MTILTRENLDDGSLRQKMPIPAHLAWSQEQLDRSLAETLAQRPATQGEDRAIWVFAYGSLIWNPLLASDAQCIATLDGWRRSFCMRTVVGRGRPEQPGRMLSLQPGGRTQGTALRLPPQQAEHELRLLWSREMAMGSYRPAWVSVTLQGGTRTDALTFVADPSHAMHETDDSVPTVARLIAVASGAFGRNIDYLMTLDEALRTRGLHDAYVEAVVAAVAEQSRPGSTCPDAAVGTLRAS